VTKKDFILIAKVISKFEPHVLSLNSEYEIKQSRKDLANAFADMLEEHNTLFDRKRFMRACLND